MCIRDTQINLINPTNPINLFNLIKPIKAINEINLTNPINSFNSSKLTQLTHLIHQNAKQPYIKFATTDLGNGSFWASIPDGQNEIIRKAC